MVDVDTDEEIRDIKKEIIESRGLIIKTNNLTNSLAADIKSIGKRQAGFERRFNWNSATAYVLFATLCFAGLKLASDARIREIESEKQELSGKVNELNTALTRSTRRSDARRKAEAAAWRFYELVRQQKREEVVRRYPELNRERLSSAEAAFFRDSVERFRLDLSMASYQSALGLMRTGRYAEAVEALRQAIKLRDDAGHIPQVRLQLARALRKLGRPSEAAVMAQQVVDQSIGKDLKTEGTWLRALCAEDMGELDQARESLRTLLRRWPRSTYAPDARLRLRAVSKRILRKRASQQTG
ncbi:MAG: tetratricopeptide repeat protein [Polyangiales bacterium]